MIDPTNDFDPSDLNGRTSSEVVSDLVAPAPVVKAGKTLGAAVLASDSHQACGQRVIFLSGDHVEAKADVAAVFEDAGFYIIDLGGLREGGKVQQVGGPLAGHNLIPPPLRKAADEVAGFTPWYAAKISSGSGDVGSPGRV